MKNAKYKIVCEYCDKEMDSPNYGKYVCHNCNTEAWIDG